MARWHHRQCCFQRRVKEKTLGDFVRLLFVSSGEEEAGAGEGIRVGILAGRGGPKGWVRREKAELVLWMGCVLTAVRACS